MNNKAPPLLILAGGMAALMIAMGIGRFAYTAILPPMQSGTGLTDDMAGYLASSNYLGYLLGALAAGLLAGRRQTFFYLLFLLVNIATTIAMGMTSHYGLWLFIRFLSGLTSGIVFVIASSLVLDFLTQNQRLSWSGLFYSGVGMGIVLSGLLVPVLDLYFGWQGAWIGLGVLALALSSLTVTALRGTVSAKREGTGRQLQTPAKHPTKIILPWLIAAYGCEGAGYIVSGTFLVALVQSMPELSSFSALIWVFVGIAAIPSCYIWAFLATKWGNLNTVQLAFFTQMIGVALPVYVPTFFGILSGACLFGATFMGITTLAISEARRLAPSQSGKVIGIMTGVYGIGQMIAPAVAGILISHNGHYDSALLLAAMILLCGMVVLGVGQRLTNRVKPGLTDTPAKDIC
ncbi:putative MFS family arabinose efflux permease [Caldalkalibacillus uzonensis]|uniref:MFS family arabinose efflux permease n=1 Tax=Caldalkalibacillus uzonensis TaxID=353224 RepID=A0ABU0CNM3_9BACI|nr:YbfB/YjiJ family MFS transporter [Caldalkalibacillus uzonensis]MDQ0338018.1 putative MFS family arabinose efflux permease [Caldalkalibacillus uzonensis]